MKLARLRGMLSDKAPTITTANWYNLNGQGWRWHCNIEVDEDEAVTILRNLQIRCGSDNVATGFMFPEDSIAPKADPKSVGVYVKDIEDLTKTLQEKLDDVEALSVWLQN